MSREKFNWLCMAAAEPPTITALAALMPLAVGVRLAASIPKIMAAATIGP